MKVKLNVNNLNNMFICISLFFAAMNFMAKFFYFCFATLIISLLMQKRFLINPTSILYIILGLLMAIYNREEGILSMIRCFAFVSLYWVGYNFMVVRPDKRTSSLVYDFDYAQKNAFMLFSTISFGSFTHYLVNFIYNYGSDAARNTNDIWTGKMMAATGQAAISCLMIGLSVAMMLAPAKKKYRFVGIACMLLIFAYDLVLACRMIPVMYLIIFLVGLLFAYKTFNSSQDRFKLIAGIVFVLLLAVAIFFVDVGGIQEKILGSNLFDRFNSSSSATSRSDIKMSYLSEWWKYPLGGLNMRAKYGYAHDLLLDGYDEYGVFGFILFAAILCLGIRELYKFMKRSAYSSQIKMVVLCVYFSILLEFCIEPILTGMPWLFACYCLINGCIRSMNIASARRERSEE